MRKERVQYLLSVCLLVLYAAFQVNITAFSHVHVLNGEKMVHSHPYSNANHSHSTDQAATIARLSSFQALEAQTVSADEVELPLLYDFTFYTYSLHIKAPHTYCVNLRAPPFC